jgi:hypothetical protein
MYQRLFQITLVLLLVVVSAVMLGLVASVVLSAVSSSPMLARDRGIVFVVGGISQRTLGFMVVAASLIIAGCYLFFRRRRLRR